MSIDKRVAHFINEWQDNLSGRMFASSEVGNDKPRIAVRGTGLESQILRLCLHHFMQNYAPKEHNRQGIPTPWAITKLLSELIAEPTLCVIAEAIERVMGVTEWHRRWADMSPEGASPGEEV